MVELKSPLDFFPCSEPRSKQIKILERIKTHFENGIQDIVIAAPTGCGKTLVGSAACLWASQPTVESTDYAPGGYYLVTQKLLQDQLERDFPKFGSFSGQCCSLKSAIEYKCPRFTTCMAGKKMPKHMKCQSIEQGNCAYTLQKNKFEKSILALTNYAYFFTERTYVNRLAKRRVMVLDEAHTIERQLMHFIELVIDKPALEKWAPHLSVPAMPKLDQFASWVSTNYVPAIKSRLEMLHQQMIQEYTNPKIQDEYSKLDNHLNRLNSSLVDIQRNPKNWIYWQQENGLCLESIAKPLYAHGFVKPLLVDPAYLRIYMSAYPGPKQVFCRSLGIDPTKVAWLNVNSTFPVENRPVRIMPAGSMGRKSQEETLPVILKMTNSLLRIHAQEKGIIHANSYQLANVFYTFLSKTEHAPRIIFPRNSRDRASCLQQHESTANPTVLLSPSMGEGYSFDDELARFQLIVKVPYPYLGDKQVAARKDLDPEWYAMLAVMGIIQSVGRGVRSDTDFCVNHILDRDFINIYEQYPHFFPAWFTDAIVWDSK